MYSLYVSLLHCSRLASFCSELWPQAPSGVQPTFAILALYSFLFLLSSCFSV